jgi:hypothetical protein
MSKTLQDELIRAQLATAEEIELAAMDLNQLRVRRNAAIKRCLQGSIQAVMDEQETLLRINKAIRALTKK